MGLNGEVAMSTLGSGRACFPAASLAYCPRRPLPVHSRYSVLVSLPDCSDSTGLLGGGGKRGAWLNEYAGWDFRWGGGGKT